MVKVLPFRVGAVIGDARQGTRLVRAMTGLKPAAAVAHVFGDAERQAQFPRRFLPVADNVALRAHANGIPLVKLRVPQIKVVAMHGLRDEIASACPLVERHQAVRIQLLGLPQRDDVLIAELRGMPVVFHVILVVARAFDVHVAGVPVAAHGNGLRPPVRPDAELRVAEPIGTLVLLQGFPRRLKRPGTDFQFLQRRLRRRRRFHGLETADHGDAN